MIKKTLGLLLAASAFLSFAPAAMADGDGCLNYITCDSTGCHDPYQICPSDDQIIHAT
ncbi:hypothetical protein AWB71_00148 [Caballeronia peredens]|nr:hypothetical protein AWB71_00148 [Caballeronia peredens]